MASDIKTPARLSGDARWAMWVGLAALLIAAAGLGARAAYGARASADEPQYLMTALSLARDGDLNIANQRYAGDYRAFHEATLPVQTVLQPDGSRISPHGPLLPAYLALPTAAGGWAAAKAALAVLAGATAALTALIASRRFGVSRPTAAAGAALMAASPPMAFYATQIYPEIPAALVTTAAVFALCGPVRPRTQAAAAACVVALPWLAVKYVPPAAVLAGVLLWRARGRAAHLAGWAAALAAAGAVFLAFNQAVYGGWTPYAAGDFFAAGEATALGPDPDFWGRSVRLLGLVTDRGFGLAAWQPAFLAVVPAVAAALVRRFPGRGLLLGLAAAGWLTASFVAQTMHGWWWPGRQVVVVVPILAILVMKWADGLSPKLKAGLAAVAATGVVSYFWLAAEATAGARALIVDFTDTANPLYRAWSTVLPDYLYASAATWRWHALWLAAAAGLAWLGARSAGGNRPFWNA